MRYNLPDNATLQGGKYRIVRFISSGGFGCTYEAVHTMLGKRFAIKEFFVKDFCNRDETTAHVTVGTLSKKTLVEKLRNKFMDEARGLCQLSHPGIVQVTDVFEECGTAYFVMDYVDGESISDIVKRRGPLPEKEALDLILQVCDALEYVHNHNRLHLDIKPGNIMVNKEGRAVLIDFGASKQYDESNGENTSTLMGKTPGYAPLEQMGNNVVQFLPATDIYALGATLYKMLTGETPLSANLLATGEGEMKPLPAGTSQNVKEAIMRSMKARKNERPQSIAEFRSLLTAPAKAVPPAQPVSIPQDTDEATIYGGNADDIREETPQEAQPADAMAIPLPFPAKSAKKGKKTILIATVACILAIVGGFIVFAITLDKSGTEDESVAEAVEVEAPESSNQVEDWEYTNSNGETFRFTGTLNENRVPTGMGVGKYSQGVYTGEYVNGLRQGAATYKTNDGSNTFEGIFDNDKYVKGRLSFSDGSYYEGTFKDNNYSEGIWHNPDGTTQPVHNGKL